ncbi:PAS sensor protein, partial [Streptomyces sp. 8P21H-1]|nr:PAS sensor protein [Streptomyces sp. 8P21H-1]
MTDVVSEGDTERGTRTLRAELALEALPTDLGPPERLRSVLEQVLVYGGAALALVYVPEEHGDRLRLIGSAGVPRALYGLPDGYLLSGGSPAADAYRTGRPRWPGPAELAVPPGA